MTEQKLSSDIKAFISRYIASVQQLEVLLLVTNRDIEWTAEMVAENLSIGIAAATNRLLNLSLKGLIKVEEKGVARTYKGQPGQLEPMIKNLREAYQIHRFEVIEFICSRTEEEIRNFSDAFRWNQGNKNE